MIPKTCGHCQQRNVCDAWDDVKRNSFEYVDPYDIDPPDDCPEREAEND
jgi:hypothetical protein